MKNRMCKRALRNMNCCFTRSLRSNKSRACGRTAFVSVDYVCRAVWLMVLIKLSMRTNISAQHGCYSKPVQTCCSRGEGCVAMASPSLCGIIPQGSPARELSTHVCCCPARTAPRQLATAGPADWSPRTGLAALPAAAGAGPGARVCPSP